MQTVEKYLQIGTAKAQKQNSKSKKENEKNEKKGEVLDRKTQLHLAL